MSKVLIFPAIVFALLLYSENSNALAEKSSVTIDPDHVLIGLFYGGQKISVKADLPMGYDGVIKIRGVEEDLHLKKKGKVWGILWMNVGEVSYSAVPSLYILSSTHKIEDVAPDSELRKWGIGYAAMKQKCAEEPEAKALFDDLVKLKEKEGRFQIADEKTRLESGKDGSQSVVADFILPGKAPVGEYTVDVFTFKDGVGSHIASKTFSIQRARLISFLKSMATNHGLVYGCIAVIIAIIAGLFTGFVFGMGQGKGH
jgi:uncharacterized protein (TIGR02186 family)